MKDAFGHLKVIGYSTEAQPLLDKAGVQKDDGVLSIGSAKDTDSFMKAAKGGRIGTREPGLRPPG